MLPLDEELRGLDEYPVVRCFLIGDSELEAVAGFDVRWSSARIKESNDCNGRLRRLDGAGAGVGARGAGAWGARAMRRLIPMPSSSADRNPPLARGPGLGAATTGRTAGGAGAATC